MLPNRMHRSQQRHSNMLAGSSKTPLPRHLQARLPLPWDPVRTPGSLW